MNDSKDTITQIKSVPTEFVTTIPKLLSNNIQSYKAVDHEIADNAVRTKQEEYLDESDPITELKLDAIGVKGNVSNSGFKLDKSDLFNSSFIHIFDKDQGEHVHASEGGLETHIGERNYKCEYCTKHFTRNQNMLRHMKIHTGERNYKCETCTKRFTTKYILLMHMRIHTNERNFECEICTKRFTRNQILLQHMNIHNERNHSCEICSKSFRTNRAMLNHMKTHTGEKNYKCEICSKCFTRKHSVLLHMQIHTGERDYKCEICARSFASKYILLMHMKIHSNEREYQCEICTKRFTTKKILLAHMNIHYERNFKCEICPSYFVTKRNMLRHMRTHIDKNNYKCNTCKQYLGKRKLLLEHRKTHTNGCNLNNSGLKFPYNLQDCEVEKRSITKGTMIIKQEKFANIDAIEKKPSTTTNNSQIDNTVMEKTSISRETFNLWQSLNKEVEIKEEETCLVLHH